MTTFTYGYRVARMKKPGDEIRELELAKKVVLRLRLKLKNVSSQEEKVKVTEAVAKAEHVLRLLRLNIFDLEDMLAEKLASEDNQASAVKFGDVDSERDER